MLFGMYAFQGNDNDYFEPRLRHQTEKKGGTEITFIGKLISDIF